MADRNGDPVPFTTTVLEDADAVGTLVAATILERLAGTEGPFLLGCPSGRSGVTTYRALARLTRERGVDLSRLVLVMMDEYVTRDADGVPHLVDEGASYSCIGFARREIFDPLVEAARAAGVPGPAAVWAPDVADPAGYDARIAAAGGVDLFLLASGASDGHIALNQPGTPRGTRTHLVELGEATRRDNMGTFPEFTTLAAVPRWGVTVGVATLADSREVVMVVTGAHKAGTFARLSAATRYQPDWPATVFAECANAHLVADTAAATDPTPTSQKD